MLNSYNAKVWMFDGWLFVAQHVRNFILMKVSDIDYSLNNTNGIRYSFSRYYVFSGQFSSYPWKQQVCIKGYTYTVYMSSIIILCHQYKPAISGVTQHIGHSSNHTYMVSCKPFCRNEQYTTEHWYFGFRNLKSDTIFIYDVSISLLNSCCRHLVLNIINIELSISEHLIILGHMCCTLCIWK